MAAALSDLTVPIQEAAAPDTQMDSMLQGGRRRGGGIRLAWHLTAFEYFFMWYKA